MYMISLFLPSPPTVFLHFLASESSSCDFFPSCHNILFTSQLYVIWTCIYIRSVFNLKATSYGAYLCKAQLLI